MMQSSFVKHASFFKQSLWIGAATLALVACSSSGDGGSGSGTGGGSGTGSGGGGTTTSSSGLPSTATAASLTDAQLTELCEWYTDLLLDPVNVDASCKRSSVLLGSRDSEVLEEQRTSCAENSSSCYLRGALRETYLSICPSLFDASCTATVGEIEGCINDQWTELRASVDGIPECAEITSEDVAQVNAPLDFATEACLAAYLKCPSFRGDSDEPEEDPPAVVSCNEACAAYKVQCGTDAKCDCSSYYVVYHEELCAPFGKAFYDCAKQGTFDCTDDSLLTGSNECNFTDYVTCYANEGVDCVRKESSDATFCKDVAMPAAYECVSTAAQVANCEHKSGPYYCCPAP